MTRSALTTVCCLFLAACGTTPPAPVAEGGLVSCQLPRPQVCTMEYNPVCASLREGGRRDYSSPCNACADDAVAAYLPGACPEPD